MHLLFTAVAHSILQMHSSNCGNDNRMLEIKNKNDKITANRKNSKTCYSHHLQCHSGMPYNSMLYIANIDTLASQRNDLSKKFFQDISQPSSCLHRLLPAPREQSIISRLRTSAKYPRVYTRTKRYCSFINYALNNYQDRIDKAPK